MNPQFDQMEPIDPTIRAHLARRSSERLPDGLMSEVTAALDAERRPHAARMPSLRWTTPRLAGGALAVALVAILAVAIVMPVLRTAPAASGAGGPAGYPVERALTSAELSAVMAGPALAINTTLVAAVTIQIRYDVCPMNRYPTLGIVEGMSSQVCVMGANLAVQLGGIGEQSSPDLTVGFKSITGGTYAFRYLAPGYLGYVGEITPAGTSRLAFSVSEQWPQPQGGETFLVSGYMTQLRLPSSDVAFCSSTSPEPAGDVLDPNATDPCVYTWLNDAPSPIPTRNSDGLTFPKEARAVDAAGAGLIDNIPGGVAVSGVFVVRQYNGPAAGDSVSCSNPGCQIYRVLAKVADISIPEARSSASATSSPDAPASPVNSPSTSPVNSGPLAPALTGIVGPGGRPLTSAELNALWAANPSSLVGRIAIVKGPVPLGGCPSAGSAQPSSGLCVDMAWISDDGYQVVRVGANGSLAPFGQLAAGNGSPLPQTAASSSGTNQTGNLVLVDAYLDWMPSLECDALSYPPGSLCDAGAVTSVLTSAPLATQGMAISYPSFPSGNYGFQVQQGAYQIFGSSDLKARPIHGLYLLRGTQILARMVPTGS